MAKAAAVETIDVFSVLESKSSIAICATVACVGSDSFLREQATRIAIDSWKIDDASVEMHYGEDVAWVDVHDQLATRSLFDEGGHKCVILKSADKFVSKYREQLEKWVAHRQSDATLLLHLDQLASNTRLYKSIAKDGALVNCQTPTLKSFGNPPDDKAIAKWIVSWGNHRHGLRITNAQANIMVERIGPIFGLLDCELAKLSLFSNAQGSVDDKQVDELVGGWRTKTAWDIADWIADGEISKAWEELDRLFLAGQSPVGLMAQMSWSLRRFGVAAHLYEQARRNGHSLKTSDALSQAGFFGPKVAAADKQLRRIGSQRALQILEWLVELDLKLKGTHSHDDRARFAIEEFMWRFAG